MLKVWAPLAANINNLHGLNKVHQAHDIAMASPLGHHLYKLTII